MENKTKKECLKHLEDNFTNVNSNIAFSAPTKLYQYYQGKLSYNDIQKFLQKIFSYSVHKETKKIRLKNPYLLYYKRQNIQADLLDCSPVSDSNNGYKYILTV